MLHIVFKKVSHMRQRILPFDLPAEIKEPPAYEYGKHFSGDSLENAPAFALRANHELTSILDIDKQVKKIEVPFGDNISSGKNTYVYDAHTYHTKVPPDGIKRLIEYYTNEGDVVLDPFCGSGMTGVAALETGRKAILSDLSPAAAFIAYNFCTPISDTRFMDAVRTLLQRSQSLEMYLYGTRSRETGIVLPMLYTVWSYGYTCGECSEEFVLWDVARDEKPSVRDSKILSSFECPHCHAALNKRKLTRTRRYPVQVGYQSAANRLKEATAEPSADDKERLADIERRGLPKNLWYPTVRLPEGINTRQPIAAGIERVDQAYTPRALWAMAHLWQMALDWPDREIREKLLFAITSLYKRVTVFSEFRFWGGSGNTANFNVPAIMNEQNVFRAFERKARTISWYFKEAPKRPRELRVSCQSATSLSQIPDASVDFVFTDPPFGGNINYSEMNVLWESWLGSRTDTTCEAIINKYQGKGAEEYRTLLAAAFKEVGRVLKKDGWAVIVFHNSSAEVWSALQDAVHDAGLAIKGTQTFDKKHGTFKQFVSQNAVGYDLVLHCQPKRAEVVALRSLLDEDTKEIAAFIAARLRKGKDYAVDYLHVRREREFDYRRLYAEWLTASIAQSRITLSFDAFRDLVNQVRSER